LVEQPKESLFGLVTPIRKRDRKRRRNRGRPGRRKKGRPARKLT